MEHHVGDVTMTSLGGENVSNTDVLMLQNNLWIVCVGFNIQNVSNTDVLVLLEKTMDRTCWVNYTKLQNLLSEIHSDIPRESIWILYTNKSCRIYYQKYIMTFQAKLTGRDEMHGVERLVERFVWRVCFVWDSEM